MLICIVINVSITHSVVDGPNHIGHHLLLVFLLQPLYRLVQLRLRRSDEERIIYLSLFTQLFTYLIILEYNYFKALEMGSVLVLNEHFNCLV